MSNLSDLLPAGASGKKASFTASGSISTGDTVVLNSDGTVTAISATALSEGFNGSAVVFDGENITSMSQMGPTAASDGNGTVVCIYNTQSTLGTAVVGIVNGSSITFGTPVIFASTSTAAKGIAYVPAEDRFVICYRNSTDSGKGYGLAVQVTGTSLNIGSPVMFSGGSTVSEIYVCTGPSRKVGVAFRNDSLSGHGYALQGTVTASTNTVQFGGQNSFTANSVGWPSIAYDPVNNRYVFAYYGASGYGVTRTGTPSGTDSSPTISYNGTENTFNSATTFYTQVVYDPDSGNLLIAYNDFGGLQRGEGIVVYVSGNNMVTGSTTEFETGATNYIKLCYAGETGKFFAAYLDGGNSNRLTYAVGTVSGTASTWATPVVYDTATTNSNFENAFDSYNNRVVLFYGDSTNSTYGTANVFNLQTTNLTRTNFLGIADAAISNAASGDIVLVGGISENATSEVTTTNSTVYVQNDGTLSMTFSSVEAGLAFGDTTSTTSGFLVGDGSYDSKSFSVSTQVNAPHGIAFKSDGTEMYVLNLGGTGTVPYGVAQYTLSTAWDVSTAVYANKSMSSSAQDTSMRGMTFKPDGTKMYLVGSTNPDTMYEYDLSTAWDISTASFNQTGNIDTQLSTPCGLSFKSDGTACFVADQTDDDIHQYSLSTAWDISTLSYDNKFLDATPQEDTVQDMAMSSDGTKFYVVGTVNDKVFQYDLTTPYDVSTASYAVQSLYVGSQSTVPVGMVFSADGYKLYIADSTTSTVYQYSSSGTTLTTSKLLLNG
jgi:hypothetical protein